MSVRITFDLSDNDLEHFGKIMNRTRETATRLEHDRVIQDARNLLAKVQAADAPEFMLMRLNKLETLSNMVMDDEWQLGDDEKQRVINALAYFGEPEDVIPDEVPGLGFLDDAIMVELVVRELKHEIEAYEEFCQFREAEEKRRRGRGEAQRVTREEWLKDKRAALHSRMRNRRASGTGGWRSVLSLG